MDVFTPRKPFEASGIIQFARLPVAASIARHNARNVRNALNGEQCSTLRFAVVGAIS